MTKDTKVGLGMMAVVVLVVLLSLGWTFCFVTVPAGHVGVVTSLGKMDENVLEEGPHLVLPWKGVNRFSLQTRADMEQADAPTKEGVTVSLEATLLFSISKVKAVELLRAVGTNFEEVVVKPTFRSVLRAETKHHKAEDLYTAKSDEVQAQVTKAVEEALAKYGIVCQGVLLRNIRLPNTIKERVEAKLAADQDAQRMEFVLRQAQQEAERKAVEAKGIADAQAIIKKDLDHNYLVYLWIEALKESAIHKNATIYVPTGADGMPLFKAVAGEAK